MNVAYCADCAKSISVDGSLNIGDETECPHCRAGLELVELNPPEFELLYEGEAEEDENWDEDEFDDEENDYSWMVAKQKRVVSTSEAQDFHSDREQEARQRQKARRTHDIRERRERQTSEQKYDE